jgi:hypothetical protein
LSVLNYTSTVEHFRRWWAYYGPLQDWKLSQRTLLRFREHLESYALPGVKPMSYHHQNDVYRRLRQVFNFADREKYTPERNYAVWVPSARGSANLHRALLHGATNWNYYTVFFRAKLTESGNEKASELISPTLWGRNVNAPNAAVNQSGVKTIFRIV